MRKTLPAVFVALALLRGAPALAQASDGEPDTSAVRVRIGPLMMNPTISISNIGIDHNVFNDPPDKNQKSLNGVKVTVKSSFGTWSGGSLKTL